jgi:hypothetical protein
VIFYLQALCPVVAEPQSDMSLPLRLLLATTQPPDPRDALLGLIAVILMLLALAALRVGKLEINYAAE